VDDLNLSPIKFRGIGIACQKAARATYSTPRYEDGEADFPNDTLLNFLDIICYYCMHVLCHARYVLELGLGGAI
jgi:hypothetical protein